MTSGLRFRIVSVATALVLAVMLGACSDDSNSAAPAVTGDVRIGLLAPLSGVNAQVGQEAQRGAELAAEVLNNSEETAGYDLAPVWGVSGSARLSIVTADTASDPRQAVAGTSRLITEHAVAGIVGAFEPEPTLDASQRADRLRVPFVSGDIPMRALTERGLSWFFRLGPDARAFASSFVSLLRGAEQPGMERRRITVLYAADTAGHDLRATFAQLVDETDYEVVAEVGYQAGDTDLTDEARAVRASDPDIVLFSAAPGAGQALADALSGIGYAPPGVVVYGTVREADPLAALPGMDGRVSRQVAWSQAIAQANPRAADIAERYQRRYGLPMTEVAASAYTAVTALAQAISDARSVEPEQVRTALVALDLPGSEMIMPWEGVRFDGTHQNTLADPVIEQAVGGQFAVVFPRDLAAGAFNWPARNGASAGG